MEMSSKMQKNPSIRFKGFTDAWEQRKVGEFLTESRLPGTNGSIAKKLTVKLWRKGVIPKDETYAGSSATQYFTRKSGQFIYGKLDFLNQAFGIIPEHLDGYESTLDSPAFDISTKLNPKFFLEYVSREQFYVYQGTIANGSRKAKRIHADTFFEMPINLPTKEEQVKIGNFLEQIDNIIALHQRQLDNYIVMKKAILKKIFNQELRFKDEHGNDYPKWINKTVNNIGDVVTGTTPSTKELAYYNNGVYPWVTPTDIDRKNISSTPRKLTDQGLGKGRVLPENTILVTCIASIGKNAILKQKGSCNQQINAIVCNENHNYEFVYYLMEKNTDILKSLAGKGTMDIVNKDVFSKMPVTVPCLEEQFRIGQFLSVFEGKLEDEKKTVNLMKKQKQRLVQQMFV